MQQWGSTMPKCMDEPTSTPPATLSNTMATGRPPPHCEMQTESQRRSRAPSFINCRQPYYSQYQ
eukprot:scaffold195936_cov17-Cyclotella_meneghiniana.AAC.1